MSKPRTTTTALFITAVVCYLAEWTSYAIGLGVLGMFFEAGMWLSIFGDSEDNPNEHSRSTEASRPTHSHQSNDE